MSWFLFSIAYVCFGVLFVRFVNKEDEFPSTDGDILIQFLAWPLWEWLYLLVILIEGLGKAIRLIARIK